MRKRTSADLFGVSSGFSLMELVVVIVILGILATMAAPRFLDTSANGTDNAVMQVLSVVRAAIEMYSKEHEGALPGADGVEVTFKNDLAPYLLGPFPTCPLGVALESDGVRMNSSIDISGVAAPNKAWSYSYVSGEFIVNYSEATKIDPSVNYDDL